MTDRPRRRDLLALSMAVLIVASGLSAFMIMVPEMVSGTFRYVGEDSTYSTLQDAIDAMDDDDIIIIGEGIINGSFTTDRTGLYIRGNSSAGSILRLEGDSISSIGGSGLIMEKLTIENGTIEVKGDNSNITDVVIGADDGSIHIKNCAGTHIDNLTFSQPDHLGLSIFNSTNVNMDGLYSTGVTSKLISVGSSSNIEIKNLDMVLDKNGTALSIDLSHLILVDDPQLISTDSNNIGILIGNSSNIEVRRGNLSIVGVGIKGENSSLIYLNGTNLMTLNPGSFGLWMDILNNTTIEGCSFTVNNGGVGAHLFRFRSILITNSSFQIADEGVGSNLDYGIGSLILNSTFTEQGDNSTGIKLTQVNNIDLSGLDWSSDSENTVFLSMDSVQDIYLEALDLDIEGAGSTGILGLQIVERATLLDSNIEIDGNAIGIDMEDWKDSLMMGTRIDVNGMSAIGLSAFASNLTSTGNVITVSGMEAVGVSLAGTEFSTSSDRIYTNGNSGVSMVAHDLMKMTASGVFINNTGPESIGIMIAGAGGTHTVKDSRIWGNDQVAQLIMIQDPAAVIEVDNSTFSSGSMDETVFSSTLVLHISDSTILGGGAGLVVMDSPSVKIDRSRLNGTIGLRALSSYVDIKNSDIGDTVTSLECQTVSMVKTVDSLINGVIVDPTSTAFIQHTMKIQTLDRFGSPLRGVDVELLSDDVELYSTEYFNSTSPDPKTDLEGMIGPLVLVHKAYVGESIGRISNHTLNVYLKGTSPVRWTDSYSVDTSNPGTFKVISPDIDLPMIPADLKAFPLDTREDILLNWSANTDDTLEYRIYQLDTDDPSNWIRVDTIDHPSASWTSEGLGPMERRLYRITAWDGIWESAPSSIASTMTNDLTPPEVPDGFDVLEYGQNEIELIWEHPGSDDLVGFELFINRTDRTEMTLLATIDPDQRSYTVRGLVIGTEYRFQMLAVDGSGNPSKLTPIIEVTTRFPILSLEVSAVYSGEGPLAGMPVFNGTASLLTFTGYSVAETVIDSLGGASFVDLDIDEIYAVHITPPDDWIGELNVSDGYIPIISNFSSFTWEDTLIEISIELPYYSMPRSGSIEVVVTYGSGPRSGSVYAASVDLLDGSDNIIMSGSTDADGKIFFILDEIPFRGRFDIDPPDGIGGDLVEQRSGYLYQRTNFFELDPSDPDYGEFPVELVYYEYIPPFDELRIIKHIPMGNEVALDNDIIIGFDQPVNRTSVEISVRIIPALNGIAFSWNADSTELKITHDDFLPEKEYRIEVTYGAFSQNGTSFPEVYSDNTWTFITVAEESDEKKDDEGISNTTLWIILILILIIIVIVFIYFRSSRKEEIDDDEEYPLSDEEYYDDDLDEDYDIEEDDLIDEDAFDDIPIDEEFDEELLDEEQDEDMFDDDEELEEEESMEEEEEMLEDQEEPEKEPPEEEETLEPEENTEEEPEPKKTSKKRSKKKGKKR